MATGSGSGVEQHGHNGLSVALGRSPEAPAVARRVIAELRADLDPPLMETLRLLVTELVTNSVRHTAADFVTLKVAVGKSSVLTEVADTGPGVTPESVEQAGADDTGWGLFLVQRLAHAWGVKHDGPAKRVWFELRRA
jgi:signal transduction histidine kinase